MSASEPVIIIGAGQAGAQVAVSLRQEGYDGRIVLIGDEPEVPYQRPPLSKAYLSGKVEAAGLLLRSAAVYTDQKIEFMQSERVEAIDPVGKTVRLASGLTLSYSHLVLALGARNRKLCVPGAELDGVAYLRTIDDARRLRQRLDSVKRAVIIGGGFIGLEFAAVANAHGIDVCVVETAHRPMARAISEHMSAYFVKKHEEAGTRILFNSGIARIIGEQGHVTHVELSDGRQMPADLVLVGIGVLPNSELAEAAGLTVRNGVVVDEFLTTSDPSISAIGDCAAFPCRFAGGVVRLESIQNAVDQARCVAAKLKDRPLSYASVPWFWSDQYNAKLQIAGITTHHNKTVVRGAPEEHSFSVFCFRDDHWLGVESVNRPSDHMAARKLLASGITLTPEQVAHAAFDLKLFAAGALGTGKPA
jgi:3-phenylpropionate/trans-cinnamate dioxygenase ferredoxin reductase subunit